MEQWKVQSFDEFCSNILCVKPKEIMEVNSLLENNNLYQKHILPSKCRERIVYEVDQYSLVYYCQKKLRKNFFSKIYYPSFVFGFIKQKSYFDYLNCHTTFEKNNYFLRLDIKDFFESLRVENFRECMEYYINSECGEEEKNEIINLFERIITYRGHFSQGIITSPDVSNLIFRSLDIRIQNYCCKLGIRYSRYADDLLFSSEQPYVHGRRFINMIRTILKTKGFELNNKKTLKQQGRLIINGYVVTDTISISRKKLTDINRHLFEINKSHSFPTTPWGAIDYKEVNYLVGYRSYLINLLKYGDKRNNSKITRIINNIDKVTKEYCEIAL